MKTFIDQKNKFLKQTEKLKERVDMLKLNKFPIKDN